MKRWLVACTAAIGIIAISVGLMRSADPATHVALAATRPPSATPNPTVTPAMPPEPPRFVSTCTYSHSLSDDPIVRPNQPGASHRHDFFGNRTTNAASTDATLRAGTTTCLRPLDTAAYWVPALLLNGVLQQPEGINAYYRLGGKAPATIQPFPAGLRIVAGDASATIPPARPVFSWGCTDDEPSAPSIVVPLCPSGSRLRVAIHFPDCWDGVHLDSTDHTRHMAYSARGRCPTTHPVPMPALTVNVRYPLSGGSGITLSSGTVWTAHADFFNTWDQAELSRLVRDCLNVARVCRGQRED